MLRNLLLLSFVIGYSTAFPPPKGHLSSRQEGNTQSPHFPSMFPTAISDHNPLTLGQPNLTYWTSTCNFDYICKRLKGKENPAELPSGVWNWWVGEHGRIGGNCAVALYFADGAKPSPEKCNTNFDDAIIQGESDKTSFRAGYNVSPGRFPMDLNAAAAQPGVYSSSEPGWSGQQFPDQASNVVLG